MLLKAYQRFEEQVGHTSDSKRQKGWKARKVQDVINHMIADFTIYDIQERCPGISRRNIQRILNQLGQDNLIECINRGRNARWKKR
jgi:CRP-like cAMP-binding protein